MQIDPSFSFRRSRPLPEERAERESELEREVVARYAYQKIVDRGLPSDPSLLFLSQVWYAHLFSGSRLRSIGRASWVEGTPTVLAQAATGAWCRRRR